MLGDGEYIGIVSHVYGYAYAHGKLDAPFGLSTTYPQREIPLLGGTLKDVGLNSGTVLRVEPDSVEFDPLHCFQRGMPG